MAIRIWEYGADPELINNSTTQVQIVEGNPISTSETFVSENRIPLDPVSGYPTVQVFEGPDLIVQTIGYNKTQQNNGEWFADLTIPEGMDFSKGEKILLLTWTFKTLETTEKSTIHITVLPRSEVTSEDYRELVMLGPATHLTVQVPYIVNTLTGDSVDFTLYDENIPILSNHASASVIQGPNSVLELGVNNVQQFYSRLRPYNLVMNVKLNTISRQLFSQVYLINPSILSAMQALEMAINKANQVETIKGLQFREVDLLQGLTRGLDYFNNVPPSLTSFTGIDMRGTIRECWLICSSIRVLRAQLQSEGMFQFDFSGQNISLTVDRVSSIESACSHYESLMDTLVRPSKLLLSKKGIISGDGSVGDKLSGMSQMGLTRLSNTTITRSRLGNAIYPRGW